MKIGEVYFRFTDLMPYEVVRETAQEYYLCRFDGSCSKIDMVSKGSRPRYDMSEAEAAKKQIEELEKEIAGINEIYINVPHNKKDEA